MSKTYTVKAARTHEAVLDGQCDVVSDFDTLKEAKTYAKRTLTEEYRISGEMSESLTYASVEFDGECLAEFWA